MGEIVWTTNYIISQIVAIIAATLVSVSFFVKKKNLILLFTLLGYAFYSLHYLLLNAYSGAIIAGFSIGRGIQFYYDAKKGKKSNIASLIVFSLMFIGGGIWTYRKWYDVLTIFAGINTTYALWQNSVCYYRWASVFGSFLWIAYMILYHSLLGTIEEVVVLVIELVGLVLYYVQKHKEKKNSVVPFTKQPQQAYLQNQQFNNEKTAH